MNDGQVLYESKTDLTQRSDAASKQRQELGKLIDHMATNMELLDGECQMLRHIVDTENTKLDKLVEFVER